MWFLYQIATTLVLLVVGPFLLLRRGRHYLGSLPGRLGRYTGKVPDAPLWIHAVSVGEVGVAHTLVRGLPADLPLLLTTVTPTGQELAKRLFKDRATVVYLPFDLGPIVKRFLNRYSPRALVLVEGDLWPLLLSRVRGRGLPIAVINGRISDRSFRRMARLRPLLGPIFGPVDRFGMQSAADRQRLLDLGVPAERVVVSGNLKFETPAQRANPELAAALRSLAGGRPILVVGSTMSGEEEAVLAAFRQIGGGDRVLLVLAPRHPERWNEVAALVEAEGVSLTRRTDLNTSSSQATDILLLDSLGELAAIYEVGLGCFVGGTLVPTGGHNPLEAALHGVAISVGPSMENFREIAAAFEKENAWRQVASSDELASVWNTWISEPDKAAALGKRGLAVIAANQGSLRTTTALLEPLVEKEVSPGLIPSDTPS
jgi:3-deoxy-D-manno-octulosonic-acid transferase